MRRNNKDIFEKNGYYHVYNKIVSNEKLFNSDQEYIDFLNRYHKYFGHYFSTYAYCLIPNHFHFLIKVNDDIDQFVKEENTNAARSYLSGEKTYNHFLENQLSRMFSGVTLTFNNKYSRSGPLFKEGTKRVLLKKDSRIIHQLCYIHHNPIHHGLKKKYQDWKFSSYNTYMKDVVTNIKKDEMIEFVGGMDRFIELHEDFINLNH